MKRPGIIILLLFIIHCYCYAQDITLKEAEQAKLLLKTSKQDTNRVTLLLKVGRFSIEKPGKNKTDLDSAFSYIQEAERLSKKLSFQKGIAYAYLLYAMAYREKGERQAGKEFANKAIAFSEKHKLKSLLGESLLESSNYYEYHIHEQSLEKINLTRRAATSFQQDGNIEKQAYSLKQLGDLLAINDSIPQAIIVLKKSLSLYQSINYTRLQGVYDLIGVLYAYIGDHQTGLEYGLLAEKTAQIVKDTTIQLCTIYNSIGLTYSGLNDDKRACQYFLKAYAVAEKYKDIKSIYLIQSNIIRSYITLGRTDEALDLIRQTTNRYPQPGHKPIQLNINKLYLAIYMAKKDYIEAQKFCNKTLDLVKEPGVDQRANHSTYGNAIELFLITQQYSKAEHYLKVHKELIKKDAAPLPMSRNYLQWFKLGFRMRR